MVIKNGVKVQEINVGSFRNKKTPRLFREICRFQVRTKEIKLVGNVENLFDFQEIWFISFATVACKDCILTPEPYAASQGSLTFVDPFYIEAQSHFENC